MEEDTKSFSDASDQDVDTSVDNEGNDTSDEDSKYLNQKKRAEKAEAEAKALRERLEALEPKPADKKEEKKDVQSGLTEDDILVISKVQDKESLDMIRKVARLDGISMSEAMEHPIYKGWSSQRAEEKKREDSQMGASKGSGSRRAEKTFSTPGLTSEEHKALYKKALGK